MRKAFTLIELLIVIAILSLLMALVAPKGYKLYNSFQNYLKIKKEKDKKNQLRYNAFISQEKNRDFNISALGVDYFTKKSNHNY